MKYVAPENDGHILKVENGDWGSAPLSLTGSNFGTQTKNHVFAAPESSDGTPSFRALAPADIPILPASKITSGTLSGALMPAFSGDITTNAASTNATVTGLQGRSVASTAPATGQVLKWDGSKWTPAEDVQGTGTVTQITTGSGLTGGPITTSGEIAIAAGGVETSHLADGAVTAAKIANGAVTDEKIAEVSDTKLAGTIKVVSGKVGIGTTNPEAKLDVDGTIQAETLVLMGGVRIGSGATVCNHIMEGTIRYNSEKKNIEFCNGSFWIVAGDESVACPEGYIPVPGNPEYNTTDFCVAKYEMKDVGGVATSQASGTPWVYISRNQARTQCENLGPRYSLITNAQWQTIARNIEQVAENWQTGVVGDETLNKGNNNGSKALEASDNDDDACFGMGLNCSSGWNVKRRTHVLSNGEVIWDFAGNVREWVYDDYVNLQLESDISEAWNDFSSLSETNRRILGPSEGGWDYAKGIGKIFGGKGGAIARGGHWGDKERAGLYGTVLNYGPTNASNETFGFRCVFVP